MRPSAPNGAEQTPVWPDAELQNWLDQATRRLSLFRVDLVFPSPYGYSVSKYWDLRTLLEAPLWGTCGIWPASPESGEVGSQESQGHFSVLRPDDGAGVTLCFAQRQRSC